MVDADDDAVTRRHVQRTLAWDEVAGPARRVGMIDEKLRVRSQYGRSYCAIDFFRRFVEAGVGVIAGRGGGGRHPRRRCRTWVGSRTMATGFQPQVEVFGFVDHDLWAGLLEVWAFSGQPEFFEGGGG